jgi:integrase
MSVKKRTLPSGKEVWRARVSLPGRKETSRQFETKRQAADWYSRQQIDLSDGSFADPARGRTVVHEWADRMLDASPHLKEKTLVGYETNLRLHILPSIGDLQIGQLDKSAVKTLIGGLTADGKGAGTVRNIKNTLSGLCEFAVDAGAIKVNPCKGVKTPKPPANEMQFLTAPQVATLADSIDPRWRTLIIFAAYAGLRAGEISALRVGRLDLMRGKVNVVESASEVRGKLINGQTKTYENRTVSLPPFLRDMLAEHIADRASDPAAFVFQSPQGSQIRHSAWRRRFFVPATREAGLDSFRFHDLRHTCAALLIALGAHPRAIMERLGHSSITVCLDRYGHLFPSLDEALTEGLNSTWLDLDPGIIRARPDVAVLETGS